METIKCTFLAKDTKTNYMLYVHASTIIIQDCSSKLPHYEKIVNDFSDIYKQCVPEIVDETITGKTMITRFIESYKQDVLFMNTLDMYVATEMDIDYTPRDNFDINAILIMHLHSLIEVVTDTIRIEELVGVIAEHYGAPITSIVDIQTMYEQKDFICDAPLALAIEAPMSKTGDTLLIIVCRIIETIQQFGFLNLDLANYLLNDIVDNLYDLGCSDTVPNSYSECAIMFDIKCINDRIDSDNVNYINSVNNDSLMVLAIRHNKLARARLLLDRGYDKSITDIHGHTAYQIACAENATEFMELLS